MQVKRSIVEIVQAMERSVGWQSSERVFRGEPACFERVSSGLFRTCESDADGRRRAVALGALVLHSASDYRERGVAVSLGLGSANREGLSLSVAPRWGDAATGGGTLWHEQVYRHHLPEAAGDAWALDVRGEYGTRLRGGSLLTWFGSLSQSAYGRRFSAGGRVGLGGERAP